MTDLTGPHTDTASAGPVTPGPSASGPGAPGTAAPGTAGGPPAPRRKALRLLRRDLALDRLSGVYVIVAMIIVFSVWEPTTFGTLGNAKVILASEAITGIIAFAAMISLVAGVFDLSIAANMSLAISVLGQLMATAHLNVVLAVIITLVMGGLVGCVNAVIVTRFRIEPVIGTLAMSSVLEAISYWVANGQTVLYGISPGFSNMGVSKPLGIPIQVYYLAAVALVLWYVLEHTPVGRYLYAAGANQKAARLSGVNVVRLQWGALITSGVLASLAGVVLTQQLGSAAFGAGDPYLLPAYAAAFLGSTQIKPGRFNVLGTVVAMYLLAIGIKGLQLRFPQYPWIADLVEGVILLLAVGLAVQAARRRARQR
jgi:ribose transport system permease protein